MALLRRSVDQAPLIAENAQAAARKDGKAIVSDILPH